MLIASLLIGLSTLASLSPALTYARLWQLKEWRRDRLLDHLRSEGWIYQLVGTMRPSIVGAWLLLGIPLIIGGGIIAPVSGAGIALLGLTTLVVAHVTLALLRRQPLPVWTHKALILLAGTMALTALLASAVVWPQAGSLDDIAALRGPGHVSLLLLLVLPLLQPLLLGCSWLLFSPLDRWRKAVIMEAATEARRAHPHLRVIGITGSVGKTTTKELLAHLLREEGALCTPMHVNTELGVSLWLSDILRKEPTDSTRILIVEMGAYRCGEIAQLCDIAQPTIGVVTYIGKQHISLFGSEEAIARGKGELLAALPKDKGQAFVNGDSPLLDLLIAQSAVPPTTAGTGPGVALRALDVEETGAGIRFQLDGTTYSVPLAGTHTVTNIVLAIAVARSLGVEAPTIQKRLQRFSAFERTFAQREERGITILDNSYNSSFESFEAAIQWAKKQPHREKVLVFAGIIELGDDEERLHTLLAEQAAPVFSRAYALHERYRRYFEHAFGHRVAIALDPHPRLRPGGLFVCMGRMPQSLIRTFLPAEPSSVP